MMNLAQRGLDDILTNRALCDLDASPLQRAIARGACGRVAHDLLTRDEFQQFFGTPELPTGVVPTLVVLICGVRAGKSFLACAAAIHGCLNVKCNRLKPFEVPRFAIVGPHVDTAAATFRQLVGILRASPILRLLIVGEPTADSVTLRRPDGIEVEICCVAASRGGVMVRNRWLSGLVIEEGAQFGAELMGAVVTAEEILRASEARLLPGGQCWVISSPFGPTGFLWDLYTKYFGKPGRVLVCRAPTRAMNPSFPQEQIDALRERDPDAAAREHDAAWLDAILSLITAGQLDSVTRQGPSAIRPIAGRCYAATQDPASRANGWTFVISTVAARQGDGLPTHVIVFAKQWMGSKSHPIDIAGVYREQRAILARYGLPPVLSDRWSFDSHRQIAAREGVTLLEPRQQDPSNLEMYENLRVLIANGQIELPPDPQMRSDLLALQKHVTQGGMKIVLPKTADGRHCDYAPALALAVGAGHARMAEARAFHQRARSVVHQLQARGELPKTQDFYDAQDVAYEALRRIPTAAEINGPPSPIVRGWRFIPNA